MNTEIVLPLQKMTVDEKLEVIDTVWEDIPKNSESVPTPDCRKQIFESRRKAFEMGETGYTNWENAKVEIRRRVS